MTTPAVVRNGLHEEDQLSRLCRTGSLSATIGRHDLFDYTSGQYLANFIIVVYQTSMLVAAIHILMCIVHKDDCVSTNP
jgi:hypothetical protein